MSFESTVEDALAGRRRRANGAVVFTVARNPASADELAEAEARLGARLPRSYRWFVSRAGAGTWCDEYVPSPAELYAFDEDVGLEMVGMIAVVWNADGTGDYVAFRPEEASVDDDPTLYLCSHDPFGCNRAARSFGEWAEGILEAKDAGRYFYEAAYAEMDRKLSEERATRRAEKKWWQIWKS